MKRYTRRQRRALKAFATFIGRTLLGALARYFPTGLPVERSELFLWHGLMLYECEAGDAIWKEHSIVMASVAGMAK